MSVRKDTCTNAPRQTPADGGTTLAKSRAKTAGETGRTARADEKRAFLTRLERSRTSLFHGSD
jgi:hypothetical protein